MYRLHLQYFEIFLKISYFGLKFFTVYSQYIILSKYVKKIDFLNPEHETISLIPATL